MTDENEINEVVEPNEIVETNVVEPKNEVVEPCEIIETKVVETNTKVVEPEVTKSRDEFINLDNLNFGPALDIMSDSKAFPDEISIF
ncbi:hypothetical protein KKE60_05080 [Patescibacteria group bacterium]|nr:hypothetical protein [Patescibacteria group bacterium]